MWRRLPWHFASLISQNVWVLMCRIFLSLHKLYIIWNHWSEKPRRTKVKLFVDFMFIYICRNFKITIERLVWHFNRFCQTRKFSVRPDTIYLQNKQTFYINCKFYCFEQYTISYSITNDIISLSFSLSDCLFVLSILLSSFTSLSHSGSFHTSSHFHPSF